MTDKTAVIFGNAIDAKTVKKAEASKQKYIKKYGDDSAADYKLGFAPIDTLDFIGAYSMLRQKFCAAATDALRLKRLEAAGYRVAALELIDPEDTPKNVMLRAVLPDQPDAAKTAAARAAYEAAYRFLTGGDG